MDVLPGVGAMGALPPAVMGTHKLGGGAYLRPEEKPIREVVLHYAMTKEGPKVTEVNPETNKPTRVVPKAEALEMMRQMSASLRTPRPAPAEGADA
ncbi:MAG: hypothetical protein IPN90_07725 [Elusimicrobia bacterium]|nr:hypothetical protein [Elusimicrobiota bacterium]